MLTCSANIYGVQLHFTLKRVAHIIVELSRYMEVLALVLYPGCIRSVCLYSRDWYGGTRSFYIE